VKLVDGKAEKLGLKRVEKSVEKSVDEMADSSVENSD
jgi:hypothetical protein